tara:strand:+ start:1656 stop:1847 length:192 start_codon:yes stop_codon:yes gene_type:complete
MKVFKSINQFLIKYEFLVLMTLAASMHLAQRNLGIEGLGNVGTLLFLIAIVSFSMKKYINKKK